MRHDRRCLPPPPAQQTPMAGLALPQTAPQHRAEALLQGVIGARNPRDLDMAIHLLRDLLLRVLTEGCFPAQLAGLAPVLSRMAALDRAFDCHLCLGLQHLIDRVARAGGMDRVDPQPLRAYVDGVARSGAFVAHPDARCGWSGAPGPCARA